jgi:hypothetical protein
MAGLVPAIHRGTVLAGMAGLAARLSGKVLARLMSFHKSTN